MKCTIPEISWHNRDPVLSVDIQPTTNETFYRLASGGTDSHVLIWHLTILDTGASSVDPVSDLTRHQKAVNVVRWSHSGQYLASGDDDANIIIWQQKSDDLAIMLDGDNDDKEKWSVFKVLRGHKEDVYDISWSPDSTKLISGSVDNTAIIWDLNKGLNDNILTDHKGFVQGVSWDPLGQYIATLSSDRVCRVFNDTGKQVKARLKKGALPLPESHCLYGQIVRYFHDDTLKSFFRRLCFSPDGSFIVTPAGCLEMGSNNKNLYTSYLFSTSNLSQPAIILPSPGQYTVAARCCPILFQLRPDGPDPIASLPYRIIFAIATRSSVILYDTQQMSPFATISNIHYTRLTDVTWSQNGRLLAVSSTDGFCSLVTFEPNELGVEYVKEVEVIEEKIQEEEIMDTSSIEKVEEKKEIKPSFLQMWTKRTQEEKDEKKVDGKIEKPISRIEVRRKPKETKIADDKIEKPISKIEVRRKPRENLDVKQNGTEVNNTKNETKTEMNKETKEEKPISKIEVRRKPRKSLQKEFINSEKDTEFVNKIEKEEAIPILKTNPNDIEKQKIEQENNETSKNLEVSVTEINKPSTENKAECNEIAKNDEKSCPMEIDDDIILINEKENLTNNTEVPTKQKTDTAQQNINKKTPSKQKTATPESKKKRGPKSKNNLHPSKLNSLKKTPTGQLNIKQFLTSPLVKASPKPKEKKDRLNPYILLEDYSKTGKTYTHPKDDVIAISDDSNSNWTPLIVSTVLNFEEDSQNIKLVLEDTDEKMEVEENTATNTETKNEKELTMSVEKLENTTTNTETKKELMMNEENLENTTNTEISNEKELTSNDENLENTTRNIEIKKELVVNEENLENTTINTEISNEKELTINDENLENISRNNETKNEKELTVNAEKLENATTNTEITNEKDLTINDENLENNTTNTETKNKKELTISDENLEITNIETKNKKELTMNVEKLENTTNTEITNEKELTISDENLENMTTNTETKNDKNVAINNENLENTTNTEIKNEKELTIINDKNIESTTTITETKNEKKMAINEENLENTSTNSELKIEKNTTNDENLLNGDIKTTECDIKCVENLEKSLTNIISLPKDSPAKKRVPLITLSSPKHKKKHM